LVGSLISFDLGPLIPEFFPFEPQTLGFGFFWG
jgi:hypothetical protein